MPLDNYDLVLLEGVSPSAGPSPAGMFDIGGLGSVGTGVTSGAVSGRVVIVVAATVLLLTFELGSPVLFETWDPGGNS